FSQGKGRGSQFKVVLPIASRASRRLEKVTGEPKSRDVMELKATPEHHKLDGMRVLVVEDDPDTLNMLKMILDESGADVVTAASTREALEALDRSIPNELVSDLAMPDQDGCELMRQVRSRGQDRGGQIPAVAVSAFARAEDRKRALDAGFQM